MGMDLFELIMEVEDHFELTFTDDESEKMSSPGDIHRTVLRKLGRPRETEPDGEIWLPIQAICARKVGLPRESITKDTGFLKDLGLD